MRRAAAPLALAAVAAVVAAAGCGGSGGGPGPNDVSVRDLALMPLPRRDVPEARSFAVSAEASGRIDVARAAETTIDPDDTPGDVASQGWRGGYDVSFVERGVDSLARGRGLIEVDTSVALFGDADAASRFEDDQTRAFRRLGRREVDAGVVLVSSATFDVGGLGDEATGLHAEFAIGGRRAYSTFVDFRLGALLCEAAVTRADRESADRRVEEIARALERRVRRVLDGKEHGPPQPLPAVAIAPNPPAGVPNLAGRVLQLRDLPAGSRIRHDGYVGSTSAVGSFRRDFHVGPERIGHTRILALQSGIDLFRNEPQALEALAAVATAYGSPSGAKLLARLFAGDSAGSDLRNGRVVSAGRIRAGDAGFAVQAEYDTPLTRVTGILVVVKVGNALGSLVATGQSGRATASDLVPLAQKLARRLAGANALKI